MQYNAIHDIRFIWGVQVMTEYRHNLQEVKRLARGRWLEILPALNNGFQDAAARVGVHVPCPVHGGIDGFRLFKDAADTGGGTCNSCGHFPDGFALLQWASGWSLPWTIQQAGQYLRGAGYDQAARPSPASVPGAADNAATIAKRERAIKSQLRHCQQEPHEPARLYYERRGIPGAAAIRSPSLLYHPGIPFYVKGKPLLDGRGGWLTFPAIVGRVSSSSGWLGLQRIYLTKDGNKATGAIQEAMQAAGLPDQEIDCKPMLSAAGMVGGAVRLGKAGRVLAVGEGLETMLAIATASGSVSVAACGTAALLAGVEIPDQVEKLLIFADKDRNGAGINAAEILYEREKNNMDVQIYLPDMPILEGKKGVDWLDVVKSGTGCAIEVISDVLSTGTLKN